MSIRSKAVLVPLAVSALLCAGVAAPAAAATATDPVPVDDTQINTAPPAVPEEDVTDVPSEGNGLPDEHAKYGVYRLKHTGVSYTLYSNCSSSTHKTITSYTPYRVGWYLWEQ
ncbi:hypothetical protein [Streptomyces sp. NPDC003697]